MAAIERAGYGLGVSGRLPGSIERAGWCGSDLSSSLIGSAETETHTLTLRGLARERVTLFKPNPT